LWGEKGYTTFERTGTRPTLEVNGIWGGYIGEGAKTVLHQKPVLRYQCGLSQTKVLINNSIVY